MYYNDYYKDRSLRSNHLHSFKSLRSFNESADSEWDNFYDPDISERIKKDSAKNRMNRTVISNIISTIEKRNKTSVLDVVKTGYTFAIISKAARGSAALEVFIGNKTRNLSPYIQPELKRSDLIGHELAYLRIPMRGKTYAKVIDTLKTVTEILEFDGKDLNNAFSNGDELFYPLAYTLVDLVR